VTDHDQWDELAAGYALDALEPEEEQRFTSHLDTCAQCTATLADHELVAAQLGSLAYDDADADPPPAWSAIRSGIVGETPAESLDERRQARHRQPWLLGAAAAVVAAAAAVVVVSQTTGGSTPASTRAIASCERSTACSVVRLHAPSGADPGVVLVSAGRATMVPLAMKPAAAGTQYVLWQLSRTGAPVPVEGFRGGTALRSAPLLTSYDDTAAFAVSVEPSTRLPARPTHVVAVGNTPA